MVAAIKARMRELNMTSYQLHQRLKGRVTKQTVYNFVEHGKVVTTESLSAIMDVLQLTIDEK
jgi:hypothetical protein